MKENLKSYIISFHGNGNGAQLNLIKVRESLQAYGIPISGTCSRIYSFHFNCYGNIRDLTQKSIVGYLNERSKGKHDIVESKELVDFLTIEESFSHPRDEAPLCIPLLKDI